MNPAVISLTTDFGLSDFDAGVLNGVILSIAPQARIAELTHQISHFNILEGALILGRCAPFFPEGSIHVAVVDPGVGTTRRGLAARLGRQFFVGPDNGLCTLLAEQARAQNLACEFHALDRPEFWLADVTRVFHGRDVFAPAAAHLARGVPLSEIGSRIDDPVMLEIPIPKRTASGWQGLILHVDHFGNLTSNLPADTAPDPGRVQFLVGGAVIDGLQATYGAVKRGELIALVDDSGQIEIAVAQGSAETRLGAGVGTPVEMIFKE